MAEITPPFAAVGPTQTERAFPKLTRSQIERIAAHGRMSQVRPGEILFESGAMTFLFIVVIKGRVEMSRISPTGDVVIATHGPGQFSGEVNMLAGRRALARATVVEAGEVLELDRDSLLSLVQTDSELGEILMRAFIIRRETMIARSIGDVILIGSSHSSGTLRIKEFLTRNGYPYSYTDLDVDEDAQLLLDRFQIGPADVPVVICRGEVVLKNPSNQQIA